MSRRYAGEGPRTRSSADPARTPDLHEGAPDEPPPVLGRWERLYALVAIEHLIVILILLWLTRRFA